MSPLRLVCGTKADQPVLCLHLLWPDHRYHQCFILTLNTYLPTAPRIAPLKAVNASTADRKATWEVKMVELHEFYNGNFFYKANYKTTSTTDHGARAVYELNCVLTKQTDTLDHVIKSKNNLCYGL